MALNKDRFEYTELQVTSNFSFLRGASHPEELVSQAKALGYRAIAITDRNTLAGIVRAHRAAKIADIQFVVGVHLDLLLENRDLEPNILNDDLKSPSISLLTYPTSRRGYGSLCRLLTLGKRRTTKERCLLTVEDFSSFSTDLISVLVPPQSAGALSQSSYEEFNKGCRKIIEACSTRNLSIAISRDYSINNSEHNKQIIELQRILGIPLLATNNVYYHLPQRRALQDVVTCVREGCTITEAGFRLQANSERHLKSVIEMERLFKDLPQALRRSIEISEAAASFSLNQLKYEYPDEVVPAGFTPIQYLAELVQLGAEERYPGGIPEKVVSQLEEELKLIHELSYEKYFLTCYDIVKFARSKDILCQGRGAAANSAVCYCLGITSVNPNQIDILFARFVSKERAEPPDIDIDFEHERREEVIQYIYSKYGRERTALTAEVVSYRYRSAIRDVGKALALTNEQVDKLAKSFHRWTKNQVLSSELKALGFNPNDTKLKNTLLLAKELVGFPRHLSQHVGGFIISQGLLSETVPILNAKMEERTTIEWDKDDIEELGLLKIDVLALGMLSCIRKALGLINQQRRELAARKLDLYSIPAEDPKVYGMISEADTIGVFQIESRAQMSMLPRLKPKCFYDLVIEVAIVRPGPIKGKMVHPYLKRRDNLEPVEFPDEKVKAILGKTLGVPIFQEQAMRLAILLANFSPGQAEKLRRAMSSWKRNEELIESFQIQVRQGMIKSGYSKEFAENCISQLKGFSEYGFPESHAASFALLVYASAWIKFYYPAEFAVSLLNSQPMGFYHPAQIINDAKAHGVAVQAIDINYSEWFSTIENGPNSTSQIRLGMHLVKGLNRNQVELLLEARRRDGPFLSIPNIWHRCAEREAKGDKRIRRSTLMILAGADAFQSLNLERGNAFWHIQALPPVPLPLERYREENDCLLDLPKSTAQLSMFEDYQTTGFSLKAQPIQFYRESLKKRGVVTISSLKERYGLRADTKVSVAGVVLFRQRPPTAKGFTFLTIEDETGITNLIINPNLFDKIYRIIIHASCVFAEGRLERIGDVTYINVDQLERLKDPTPITVKPAPYN